LNPYRLVGLGHRISVPTLQQMALGSRVGAAHTEPAGGAIQCVPFRFLVWRSVVLDVKVSQSTCRYGYRARRSRHRNLHINEPRRSGESYSRTTRGTIRSVARRAPVAAVSAHPGVDRAASSEGYRCRRSAHKPCESSRTPDSEAACRKSL